MTANNKDEILLYQDTTTKSPKLSELYGVGREVIFE